MAKQLLFKDEGRRKILSGVEQLARAVKVTLGPKGRNVVIDKKFGSPTVTCTSQSPTSLNSAGGAACPGRASVTARQNNRRHFCVMPLI